jgi:hypothetical protein
LQERETVYFEQYSQQYFAHCSLTIEEWKTEQQLFAKAVSVNSSESAKRNVWLGSLDIQDILEGMLLKTTMNGEFDPGSG